MAAAARERDALAELVEDGVDELGLERHGLRVFVAAVPLGDRLLDRLARRPAVEVLEPQVVLEQVRHPALEPVQPRERVLAQGDEHVQRKAGRAQEAGQLLGGIARLPAVAVVEEELLELVQDQQHRRVRAARPGREVVRERPARRLAGAERGAHAVAHCAERVLAPAAHDDRDVLRGDPGRDVVRGHRVEVVDDPREQHGALAHARRGVQQRQPGGDQVRGDDLALGPAAEEVGGVLDGERDEPAIRARGAGARRAPIRRRDGPGHDAAARAGGASSSPWRARSSPATYSSSETSWISTLRSSQNAQSSSCGCSWTAHEL